MIVPLPKTSTGIKGLDQILHGGYPSERLTLLHGTTGTGKTMIGLQFLIDGASKNEPGILISFEESCQNLCQNALSLGWDLESFVNEQKLLIVDLKPDLNVKLTGEFDLLGFFALLEHAIAKISAKRILIDAFDLLLQILNNSIKERAQLYLLHDWLYSKKLTALLTAKLTGDTNDYPYTEFLADCVIRLFPFNENRQRLLTVVKYRGSDFISGEQPYAITSSGVILMPLIQQPQHTITIKGHISTGLTILDSMMDGGYYQGSCIIIAGPSGTGKSTFASHFVTESCKRNEKVLYINFEESQNNMILFMKSSGLDLETPVNSGLLKIESQIAESSVPELHLYNHIQSIESFGARHVVIDAISSCVRMGSSKAAFSYLLRILTYCRSKGITVLLTNQISGFQEIHQLYGIGFSSLIDTLLILDYVQIGGEVNRTLMVLKARGSRHSNQYREFIITDSGIQFMEVYTGKGGMLTGVARLEQEYREELEAQHRKQEIESKKKEIQHLKSALQSDIASTESNIEKASIELDILEAEDQISQRARLLRESLRESTSGTNRLHQHIQSNQMFKRDQNQ